MNDHGEGMCQVPLCAQWIYHVNSTLPPPIYVEEKLVGYRALVTCHKPVKNLENGTVALRH